MSLDASPTRSQEPPQQAPAPTSTDQSRPAMGWLEAIIVFAAMTLTAVAVSAVFKDLAWLPPVLVSAGVIGIVGAIFRRVPVLRTSGTAVIAQSAAGLIAVCGVGAEDSVLLGVIRRGDSFRRAMGRPS